MNFTNSDMISARTAGTAINVNFRQWLDRWATHAQWLEARHVPLIVRPLHEHNCCFWYVDKPDLPNFYRYIFNYLTKTKGLHNLLFAHSVAWWGGNNGPAGDKHQYMTLYPGDAYVDILGFDLYRDLSPASSMLTSDDFRMCPYFRPRRKPIALTEFGPDDPAEPNAAKADYRKLIKGIRSYCPEITYWNSWSVEWSMTTENNNFVKDLLNDPWVVNLNDIPRH